jgi:hypothetical protein
MILKLHYEQLPQKDCDKIQTEEVSFSMYQIAPLVTLLIYIQESAARN